MSKLTGVELIAQERKEQIEKHGWALQHDHDEHPEGELVRAACAIAYDSPLDMPGTFAAPEWAWAIREYKQKRGAKDEKIERLVVAGALIAAEIDRLQNLPNHDPSHL